MPCTGARERLTRRIGRERQEERDDEVKTYQALPLVKRKQVPKGVSAPDVAVVGADGGGLQILDRSAMGPADNATETDAE